MKIISKCAVFAVAGLWPALGLAEDPPPFEDFTFKRVTVPGATAGKRITVQIAPTPSPEADIAARPPAQAATVPVPTIATYDWFWATVPTEIETNATLRLDAALLQLTNGPGGAQVVAPRIDTLRAIVEAHGPALLAQSVQTNVSPSLALAVIAVESAGRAEAVSGAGAQGLMQLIPTTADRFGVTDPFDPVQNIRGGMTYLAWLLDEFEGDAILALAGYNAGENAVKSRGGVPPFPETRDYVPKVLAAWTVARGLCTTPPDLVTDGCVFVF